MAKNITVILLTFVMGVSLTGCEQEKGPAERAGERIDEAAERAGDQMGRVRQKLDHSAEQARTRLEAAIEGTDQKPEEDADEARDKSDY